MKNAAKAILASAKLLFCARHIAAALVAARQPRVGALRPRFGCKTIDDCVQIVVALVRLLAYRERRLAVFCRRNAAADSSWMRRRLA